MSGTLLERILFTCRHQFSWPRRTDDGGYYQICLQCGTRYRYDWSAMRRVSRLDNEAEAISEVAPIGRKPIRKCGGRDGWHPRERRLRIDVPVLYRAKNDVDWLNGRSINISRSGLLFTGDVPLAVGTEVELMLEMPAEICGAANASVICQARIARAAPEGDPPQMAAAIADYQFLAQGQMAV